MGTRYERNFLPQSGECCAKYSARCRVLNAKRMWRAAIARAGRHYQTGIASHSEIDGDKRFLNTFRTRTHSPAAERSFRLSD